MISTERKDRALSVLSTAHGDNGELGYQSGALEISHTFEAAMLDCRASL